MLELYEWPPTRSQRAKWVLEEVGMPYSSHLLDMNAGEQKTEEYKAISPLSVVPALKSGDYTMFESVAIVLQQIDEHPERCLAPAIGTAERALYYQWSVFACAELDPALMMIFDNTMRPISQKGSYNRNLAEQGRQDFAVRADVVSKALKGRDYLLGGNFSGADILIGHSCFMATLIGVISDYPVLQAYLDRLKLRPAYQRAYNF
ncbi:MAG: glutathione S-transferase family protein [Sneathiella sp.]